MSRLQEQTKPLLTALLEGQEVVLHRKDQQLLARWCAMFVMTNEFSNDDITKVAIPLSEREYVMNRNRVPSNWRIWIGRYRRSSEKDGLWAHHSIPIGDAKHIVDITDGDRPIANTQATTFSVGELYVTVLSSAITQIVRRWHFGHEGEGLLRQIWPIVHSSVYWPLPLMVPENAARFSSAFFYAGTKIEVGYGKPFSPNDVKF